ncbi:FadR/GntR family transcriptional regulator [Bradyrhizobium sp.]|uniref:FadR/GntR family transcriptional regulator n=1 Tax=Bradyrhizobium sp. TaxID=376 RepID=UPI0025BE5BA7|nr:FCD domain-containing protein [Bradyrhizobium sp.]
MALKLEPIRNEPAYRIVAREIGDRIIRGEIAVGEALPSEMALAEQLKVNRSTVREAIRVVEQNGLVRRRDGGKKLYVTAPRSADLAKGVQAAMILQEVTFRELWEVLQAVEPLAAEASARNATQEQIDKLADNFERTRYALDNRHNLTELDIEFHHLVAEASGNRALQLSLAPISQLFYPAFYKVFARLNAGDRLLFAHQKIIEAIKTKDEREARAWMERHIADFKRGYELANLDMETVVGPARSEP